MDENDMTPFEGIISMDPALVHLVTASKAGVAYVGLVPKDEVPGDGEFAPSAMVLLAVKAQVPGTSESVELHLVLTSLAAASIGLELLTESAIAAKQEPLSFFKERSAAERAAGA